MKLLISGGTGFLGEPLVHHLSRAGYDCVVLTRRPAVEHGRWPPNVALYGYDDPWPAVDGVINLAGETIVGLWTRAKRAHIIRSRVIVTRRLVSWMAEQQPRPRCFLSASAVGYYGHRPGELLEETSPPDPRGAFRSQVCRIWEAEAEPAAALGVRTVLLRLGNILHPDGGYLGKLRRLYHWTPPLVMGAPDGMLSWISREDSIRLIQFALEQETIRGALNVTAPQPATQAAFTQAAADLAGRRVWGRLPEVWLRLLLGEFASAFLDSQAIRPSRALAAGFQFRHETVDSYFDSLASARREV